MVLTPELEREIDERGARILAKKAAPAAVHLNGDTKFEGSFNAMQLMKFADIDSRISPLVHRRRGFKKATGEPDSSSYDQGLANVLALLGADNQYIIHACIWAREQNGEDTEKCKRTDYWETTLGKARGWVEQLRREQAEAEARGRPKEDETAADWLCRFLGVPGWKVEEFRTEPREYRVSVVPVEGGEWIGERFSSVRVMETRRAFATMWAQMTRSVLPENPPGVTWPTIFQRMLDSIEEVDMDGEGSDREMTREILRTYIDDEHQHPGPRDDERLTANQPFIEDGKLWFSREKVVSWALLRGWKIDRAALRRGARDLGGSAKSTTFNVREPRVTTRSYNWVPLSALE